MYPLRVGCILWKYASVSQSIYFGTRLYCKKGLTPMANLFTGEKHADLYSKYRPVYPPAVLEHIVNYCKESAGSFDHALDVGCGSGQSTIGLLKYYSKVSGSDVSEAQVLKASVERENVTFHVSSAENLSFAENNSVDLVTVGQAIHWFDLNKFYAEVERILTKNGVLAVYGYGNVTLDISEGSHVVKQFYQSLHDGNYWHNLRQHVDTHYHNIQQPQFSDFIRDDSLEMKKQMPLSAFIGYLSSWSAYNDMMKDNPNNQSLQNVHQRLAAVYCESDEQVSDPEVEAKWPLFILLARKM